MGGWEPRYFSLPDDRSTRAEPLAIVALVLCVA